MKIIITESQYELLLESKKNSNVVEKILEMENIKVYYGYKNRLYSRSGYPRGEVVQFDDTYVSFRFPDGHTFERVVRFKTIKNKVIGVSGHDDFSSIVDGFNYIPKEIVTNYFIEKLKTHLEKVLPFEYRKDNDSFI